VVIGIEDYLRVPDVPFARADAATMADVFVYSRGIPLERVRLLTKEVSRETMLAAVEDAGKRTGPHGIVWIYFSGHGAASPDDGARMVLGDDTPTDPVAFAARAVRLEELEAAGQVGGAHVILITDACYTGVGRDGQSLLKGKRPVVPVYALQQASKKVTEWVAAGPNEMAGPLPAVSHGAFTYFLVGAMRGWADGEVDGRKNGTVTVEEAQAYVSRMLRVAQADSQQPTLLGAPAGSLTLVKGRLERAPPAELFRGEALSVSKGRSASARPTTTRAKASPARPKAATKVKPHAAGVETRSVFRLSLDLPAYQRDEVTATEEGGGPLDTPVTTSTLGSAGGTLKAAYTTKLGFEPFVGVGYSANPNLLGGILGNGWNETWFDGGLAYVHRVGSRMELGAQAGLGRYYDYEQKDKTNVVIWTLPVIGALGRYDFGQRWSSNLAIQYRGGSGEYYYGGETQPGVSLSVRSVQACTGISVRL
jgi:hypothetical protein